MRVKLTAELVRKARAQGKRAYFWDTAKPGLRTDGNALWAPLIPHPIPR